LQLADRYVRRVGKSAVFVRDEITNYRIYRRLSYPKASYRGRSRKSATRKICEEDCKVAFFTAKDAKSAKEMLAMDIS